MMPGALSFTVSNLEDSRTRAFRPINMFCGQCWANVKSEWHWVWLIAVEPGLVKCSRFIIRV
jgi:hypothetical protein